MWARQNALDIPIRMLYFAHCLDGNGMLSSHLSHGHSTPVSFIPSSSVNSCFPALYLDSQEHHAYSHRNGAFCALFGWELHAQQLTQSFTFSIALLYPVPLCQFALPCLVFGLARTPCIFPSKRCLLRIVWMGTACSVAASVMATQHLSTLSLPSLSNRALLPCIWPRQNAMHLPI